MSATSDDSITEIISATAPATVSNVVCGFDCLGFALDGPNDLITIRKRDKPGLSIKHLDDYALPTEPERNVAGVALNAMLAAVGADFGLDVEITKGIKPGSGIGSSSASSCAAVTALNAMLGGPFKKLDLVLFAMEGERLAAGIAHADNAAPCIFGGFTLVRSAEPLDIVPLQCPPFYATVLHPQIEVRSADARKVLPRSIELPRAVEYWSNLGAFVAGLSTGDYDLIARSMVDAVIEPARQSLIPNFEEVRSAGLEAGALAGGISGSGPSIFMLSRTKEAAVDVGNAMQSVYAATGIEFNIHVSAVAEQGARVVETT